jgi:sterol desaturase/sphingolipid hydroxylase (fatty acid hydroxylase superfamily)
MNPSLMIPLAAVVVLIILERAIPFARSEFLRRYFITDIFYLVTGFGAGGWLAMTYVSTVTDLIAPYLAVLNASRFGFASSVLIALVFLDLGNYVAHTLLHRHDVLWEFHKAHHSSRKLDWLAAFRSHIVEQLLRRILAPFLLIIFGFAPEVVAVAGGLFIAWGIFNHANLAVHLPWLEFLFITPALHRAHHVSASVDQNLGTVFSIWDRLRGTLVKGEVYPDTVMGIPGETDSYPQSWGRQFVQPFQIIAAGMNRESTISG